MEKFELVEIVTKDKLVHQGIFFTPPKHTKKALLWVHGLTGKFYGNLKLMNLFAKHCEKYGMGFAAFNNRGHDIISNFKKTDGTRVTIGAGGELFEESVFDIEASVAFLVGQGFSEIILVGHSTGANKVCYYAATNLDPRVTGIVLAGPMSDRLSRNTDKEQYDKNMTMLKMLIDEGKGAALITKVGGFPMTANRLWSLLAPNTKEDIFNYGDTKNTLSDFGTIQKPLLVVFSENDETADRPITTIKNVFDTHTASKNFKSIIIPDTTHSYEGKEVEFVKIVVSWGASI